ncbi:hypothetical protein BHM03_00039368, partial [Ensete ventricosum]
RELAIGIEGLLRVRRKLAEGIRSLLGVRQELVEAFDGSTVDVGGYTTHT